MCTGLKASLVLLAVVAIATATPTGGSPQSRKCPFHQFFDSGTNDCEPCQEICDKMNLTGTEEMCKKECTDYIRSRTCKGEEYYDDVVHSCAHCSVLCDVHILKKTTNECFNKCRDYFQREQNPKPANGKVDTRSLPNTGRTGGGTQQLSSNSGTLVAIVVISSAALIVVIVVGIAVWFWKHHPRRPDNRQPEVRYAAATQEDYTGTSDNRAQRSQIALMSGEAYPEDFGPSYHSACEDSGADCRSSVPSSVVTS